MKKIIIPILTILIILTIVIVVVTHSNNTNQKEENIKNIKATTETFTLTDNGTEIEVKLTNKNEDSVKIKNVEATLYNTENKKITTLNYKKEITIKKDKIIKITSKEKYPETANIKYKISN